MKGGKIGQRREGTQKKIRGVGMIQGVIIFYIVL
jgi:hypothetical protein